MSASPSDKRGIFVFPFSCIGFSPSSETVSFCEDEAKVGSGKFPTASSDEEGGRRIAMVGGEWSINEDGMDKGGFAGGLDSAGVGEGGSGDDCGGDCGAGFVAVTCVTPEFNDLNYF